ncbi:DUF4097 family beta strand repeat-containing protein [Georgenia sp. Z1491]|uniref:DUF4097 family beta strand repeat-containing protein n=1 Tax=Georgenia sp. Z1491 TaxID=3416707 RepID=UPI003CF107F6
MSTDDTTRETPAREAPVPTASTGPGNPGRTILVGLSALLVGLAAVPPALGYVQGRPDGRPLDVDGTTAATTIEVDTDRADVTVVPTAGDEIEWSVVGGRGTTSADLTESGDTATLEVDDGRGGWARIGPSFDLDWMGRRSSDTALVTVAVPEGTDVVVSSGFGRVQAEDVALGDLSVESSFGSVLASGSAENLDLRLDYGEVTAVDLAVAGAIEVYADFGDVELRSPEVPTSVDVEASFGDVTVALPPGPYSVSHGSDLGDVRNLLEQAGDGPTVPVRLHTSFGSVTAETY